MLPEIGEDWWITDFELIFMDNPIRRNALLEATRSFLSAQTAQDVIETVMRAGQKLTGAAGASFVSFDEWGNALMQLTHGAVPESALDIWPDRLSQLAEAGRHHGRFVRNLTFRAELG